MLREMPAADFLGWKSAVSLGLIDLNEEGESRKQDVRTAAIDATIRNLFRRSPLKIEDVLIKWERRSEGEKRKKSPQEMLMLMRTAAMAFMTAEQRKQHFGE